MLPRNAALVGSSLCFDTQPLWRATTQSKQDLNRNRDRKLPEKNLAAMQKSKFLQCYTDA